MEITANQRMFNEALAHIRKQSEPSMASTTTDCMYRDNEGRSCAFAPAIAEYNTEMEGMNAKAVIHDFPENMYPWALEVDRELACVIQNAHDNAAINSIEEGVEFLPDFERNMAEIANEYGLEINYK